MVQLVNGYPCHNSADAALARRGISPVAPSQPGVTPSAGAQAATVGSSGMTPLSELGQTGRGRLVNIIA